MTIQEKAQRYAQLAHAIQSGIEYDKNEFEREHKHLRLGINTAHTDHAALVSLLMRKGVITEDEYWDALLESLEREVERYEKALSKAYGANIKLG